jgi:alpha-tubulin suppressor-like RCC1 family protein
VVLVLAGCDRLFELDRLGLQVDGSTPGNPIAAAALGDAHTCAVRDGAVRCWGLGNLGRLGYGNTTTIGDNEIPSVAGNVDVGASVIAAGAGLAHTCMLDVDQRVRCWGWGSSGRLGYGDVRSIGDSKAPSSAGVVNVGFDVAKLAVGGEHTCVVAFDGRVRCWGLGNSGRLGYGNIMAIGDTELPHTAGDVQVGVPVKDIVAGAAHTCVLTGTNAVRCWGEGGYGQLGYDDTNDIGDNEMPSIAGDIAVGGQVRQLAAGAQHTCALLEDATIRCWGAGSGGRLGYGNEQNVGDNESPASVGSVDVGMAAVEIAAGGSHTCAVLADRTLRCWGSGVFGQLGHGSVEAIGDTEKPAAKPVVPVGAPVDHVWTGRDHTCVQIASGGLRCWGRNLDGRLGYSHVHTVGDNEPALTVGDVPAF